MHLNHNPVLTVAAADYQPNLVRIEPLAIKAQRLGTPGAMGATLPCDAQAGRMNGIPYFIVINSLNFQFWAMTEAGFSRYEHNGLVGALAMQQAFHDAWERIARRVMHLSGWAHTSFVAASLRARILNDGVGGIFEDIPAAADRERILLEVLDDPDKLHSVAGRLHAALLTHKELGWEHAQLLADAYPQGYGDAYLKKAQLTLMFIAGQWNERHPELPCTLNVTAAADYQLPKVLRALGILDYAPGLAAAVDEGRRLEPGGGEERAIRAATVLACEQLARHLNCSIAAIDSWLWLQRNQGIVKPFHLTETTLY